jgi:hypothetical protein
MLLRCGQYDCGTELRRSRVRRFGFRFELIRDRICVSFVARFRIEEVKGLSLMSVPGRRETDVIWLTFADVFAVSISFPKLISSGRLVSIRRYMSVAWDGC